VAVKALFRFFEQQAQFVRGRFHPRAILPTDMQAADIPQVKRICFRTGRRNCLHRQNPNRMQNQKYLSRPVPPHMTVTLKMMDFVDGFFHALQTPFS